MRRFTAYIAVVLLTFYLGFVAHSVFTFRRYTVLSCQFQLPPKTELNAHELNEKLKEVDSYYNRTCFFQESQFKKRYCLAEWEQVRRAIKEGKIKPH